MAPNKLIRVLVFAQEIAAAFALFAVEEEERAVEEEIEEDEEFEFKVVFDEEFELEVTFDEVEVVEFDVVFPEVDEPKRAVIGIPSVASEIAEAIAPL